MELFIQFGLPVIEMLFGLFGVYLVALIVKKIKASDAEKQAIEALASAVSDTYQEYVKPIKANGGKLSEKEKEQAKKRAIEGAKVLAKGAGKDLLLTMTKSRLGQLVETLVSKAKK